jgi:hypothetical protein
VLSIPGFIERRSSKTSPPSREAHMLNRLLESSPHGIWKWLAYALVLLAPGSFIVLAVVSLIRHLRARNGGWLLPPPIHACNSASRSEACKQTNRFGGLTSVYSPLPPPARP